MARLNSENCDQKVKCYTAEGGFFSLEVREPVIYVLAEFVR